MSAAEDQVDVERVLAGDHNAFEGIVRRWQNPLINSAFRFCGERGRSEDLAQEVFLRAYRSLGSWRRASQFSTWLFSIALNLYRSDHKSNPPSPIRLEEIPEPCTLQGQDSVFQKRRESEGLHRAILSLPKKYREAVLLFHLQELSLSETAVLLQVSEGTLKTQLFRARKMLRKKLSYPGERKASA